jgi:hypothetical protein
MLTSHKSNGQTKGSNVTTFLKQKASKNTLPKKKKQIGLTDKNTISIVSTLPETPSQTASTTNIVTGRRAPRRSGGVGGTYWHRYELSAPRLDFV